MSLIKSISGIRGTIGGKIGDNLTPVDLVQCATGFGHWMKSHSTSNKIIVGRDGRLSGNYFSEIVIYTLCSQGFDVIDLGLTTTPTLEMMILFEEAGGGIMISASHNPKEWNALKFLNSKGEALSFESGQDILDIIHRGDQEFANYEGWGKRFKVNDALDRHIQAILELDLVDKDAIQAKNFHVICDCINSTGALALPALLKQLNVSYELINADMNSSFAHNPEPLPKNLGLLSETVVSKKADLGIAVDPDVDRLAFIREDGIAFGEEYTLVAAADYVLSQKPGNTVSNLSSTRALSDITYKHNNQYFTSAVGEVNVVNAMKEHNAIIGGEGNGGVILSELHYGRDALVGIALVLSHLAIANKTLSELAEEYPAYTIIKDKIDLSTGVDIGFIFERLGLAFQNEKISRIDGLKIDFESGWVHVRKSNTEPIIRIYAEARSSEKANDLINLVRSQIED